MKLKWNRMGFHHSCVITIPLNTSERLLLYHRFEVNAEAVRLSCFKGLQIFKGCNCIYESLENSSQLKMLKVQHFFAISKFFFINEIRGCMGCDMYSFLFRVGSRTAATSKMERFVIIINGWKPLAIITRRSILDVVAVLDAPLQSIQSFYFIIVFVYLLYQLFI